MNGPQSCHERRALLGEYLSGSLAPELASEFEDHLTTCQGCGAALAELHDVASALQAVTTHELRGKGVTRGGDVAGQERGVDTRTMPEMPPSQVPGGSAAGGSAAGADPDIEFGKYLIAQGIVGPDQIREAYKLLVGYRAQLPNVNLAQVLARHEMGTKEGLRDAYQAFRSGGGSGIGSGFGSGVGSAAGSGVGSGFGSGVGSAPGSGFGSGVGSAPGSGFGSGVGSGFGSGVGSAPGSASGGGFFPAGGAPGSGVGSSFGFQSGGGSAIPPTIDPDAPVGSNFGSGAFGAGSGMGSGAFGAGSGMGSGAFGSGSAIPPTIDPDAPSGLTPSGSGFGGPGSGFGAPAGSGFGAPGGSGFGSGAFGSGSGIPATIDPDGATLGPGQLNAGSAFGGGSAIPPTIDPDAGPMGSGAFGGPGSAFGAGSGSAFGAGSGMGSGAFGSGSAIPPTIDPDNATLVGGAGSGFASGSGPGTNFGPGSAFGSGPGAPAGSAFGGGPGTGFGSGAFGSGPGAPAGSAFGSGPGGSAFGSGFGSGAGSALAPNKPKIDLPAPAQLDLTAEAEDDYEESLEGDESLEDEEEEGEGPSRPKRRRRSEYVAPKRNRIPMGPLIGVGVVLVLVGGFTVSRVLSSKRQAREKAEFLELATKEGTDAALDRSKDLSADVLEDEDVRKQVEELQRKADAAKARAAAQERLAELANTRDLEKRIAICDAALEVDVRCIPAYVARAQAKYALAKRKALRGGANLNRLATMAIADVEAALQQGGHEDPSTYYARAMIALDTGNQSMLARARTDLRKVKDLDPDGLYGALSEGQLSLMGKPPYDKAVKAFGRAIKKDSESAAAFFGRGEAHVRNEDYAAARKDLDRAVSLDATLSAALSLRGVARFKANKDRQGALKDLNAALKLDPTLVGALSLRSYVRLERDPIGIVISSKEIVTQAKKDAEAALKLDSKDYTAHLVLAELHQEDKVLTKAVDHAERAVRASRSQSAEALLVRARIRVRVGDMSAAIDDLKKILVLEDKHARAKTLLAGLLIEAGDLEQARFHLDQALEIDRNLAPAFYNRGLVNLRQEPRPQLNKAIEDFSQAIGLQPDFALAYYQRAISYYESHRFEDALKDFDRALELRAKFSSNKVKIDLAHVLYVRALCNFYLENWEDSIKGFDDFLEKAPSTHRGRTHAQKFRGQAQKKLEGE